MKRILILSFLAIAITSCKKNESQTSVSKPLQFSPGHGVFIVNEGAFQQNNASVSYLNLDSLVIHNNLFTNSNGVTLGDVAQSITVDDNKAYIVLNNSRRIECVSCSSFKFIKSIDGFQSPSYFLNVGASKAYVSDSFANKVSIINTLSNSVTGAININAPTGNMLQAGDEVFVASPGTYNVYVINTETDSLIDSIPVGNGPSSLCLDKNGMVWVYCAGNYYNSIHSSLYEINPHSHDVVNIISFPTVYSAEGSLCMNATKDTLYFIHRDVYRMSINDDEAPHTTFISSGGGNLNGLYKTPDGRLVVSDNRNSNPTGTVYIYKANGALIKSLAAGVNPGAIVFY